MDAVDVQVEELAVPTDPGDGETVQRRGRWVEGLEHADRADLDAGNHPSDGPLAEERRQRLDLRQFRHPVSLPIGPPAGDRQFDTRSPNPP